MELSKIYKRWIVIFICVKLILLGITFFLSTVDAYTEDQMSDVRGILFPTFAISIVIFFKYLRHQTNNEDKVPVKKGSKTEYYVISVITVFYFILIMSILLSLKTDEVEFQNLKSSISWIESFFSAIYGWIISDINLDNKKLTGIPPNIEG